MNWVWGIYNLFNRTGLVYAILQANGTQPGETLSAVLLGIGFLLCVAVPYLLGSVNFALVISKRVYHDDVRRHGSGNAGSTNVLRTYGKKAAILTFLGDGLKGVLSILFACLLFGCPDSSPYFICLVTAAYLAAFFAIFGHVFPCYYRFRGGKGFATTALSILALNPIIFAILLFVFFPLVIGSRYVSLGSVVTVLVYPVLLKSLSDAVAASVPNSVPYGVNVLIALLIAALVTWAHRGNLVRIMNHTERKLNLGKKKTESSAANESEK